jgi:hypothetical protein
VRTFSTFNYKNTSASEFLDLTKHRDGIESVLKYIIALRVQNEIPRT